MQIAICDDEKSIGLILEEKIKKLLPDAVIEKYLSGDELIASGCEPDILFLDIQMPGMDGMETARILRQKNERMVLIFVTAVEEYVFQAFDVAAFHYLVKPFSDEKFEEVVKCAVRSIEKYSENQSDEKYMMVQSGGSHMKVFLKDIVYAEVYNRKVIIHTRDTNIEYYGKLQELSEIAGADFFRTHRAYLVHFKYVQKYDARRAGCDLVSYLTPRLFSHIGIKRPTWETDPLGNSFGAGGLFLTLSELHKFGLFYLNKGKWNGKQILSEEWIEESTKPSDTDYYGYLFWRGEYNSFRADGKYSQLSIVIPDKNTVISLVAECRKGEELMRALYDFVCSKL